jgi:predicted amidohydrolase
MPVPEQNLTGVRSMLDGYSEKRPDFILLPEIFTCPYDNSCFPVYAQRDGESVYRFLSDLAREHECYLIGGSVPEKGEDNRLYNTSYVFDRKGNLIGKHRKAHLFDFIGNSDFEGAKNKRTFVEHTLDDRIMNIINRP